MGHTNGPDFGLVGSDWASFMDLNLGLLGLKMGYVLGLRKWVLIGV